MGLIEDTAMGEADLYMWTAPAHRVGGGGQSIWSGEMYTLLRLRKHA